MGPRSFHSFSKTLHPFLARIHRQSALSSLPAVCCPQNAWQQSRRYVQAPAEPAQAPVEPVAKRKPSLLYHAESREPLDSGEVLTSALWKRYVVKDLIYENPTKGRLWRVYRAMHDGQEFILKEFYPLDYQYTLDLHYRVQRSPHVRTPVDRVPRRHIFVFAGRGTLLDRVDTSAFPPAARKAIIRDALIGLADLHDKRIIHTDINPTNIKMQLTQQEDGILRGSGVQIVDMERAYSLPPKANGLTDRIITNPFYRSPEAWAHGIQNTYSDIYSFALVAIYVWTGREVLRSPEASRQDSQPTSRANLILRQHLSFFAKDMEEDVEALFDHCGGLDNYIVRHMMKHRTTFTDKDPRMPFEKWQKVDPLFRHLISKMTCWDPLKRISAREALDHPWFRDAAH